MGFICRVVGPGSTGRCVSSERIKKLMKRVLVTRTATRRQPQENIAQDSGVFQIFIRIISNGEKKRYLAMEMC